MKWVKFEVDGKQSYGILDGETIQVTENGWDDIVAGAPVAATVAVRAAATAPATARVDFMFDI